MIKIMLVDDEVLALNYLRNLVDWEKLGFEITGCASSGKKALEMYERSRPDVVISDIKMVGMDGLELAMRLKEKDPQLIFLLLSAYQDFEYAKKGIQYGVKNYLLKHELSEETLEKELEQIKEHYYKNSKREKVYQKYLASQLIRNQGNETGKELSTLGNRFCLVMVQRSSRFCDGTLHDTEFTSDVLERLERKAETPEQDILYYVSDVSITGNTVVILYRIDNTASKYLINTLIDQKCRSIKDAWKEAAKGELRILYSEEISQREISSVFRKMAGQIRYSSFWKEDVCALYKLPQIIPEERVSWGRQLDDLREAVYKNSTEIQEMLVYLFEQVNFPYGRLEGLRELIHLLEQMLCEIEEKEGFIREKRQENCYRLKDIQKYYVTHYVLAAEKIRETEDKKYSKTVVDILRYIRKNYQQELNLDILGDVFQMNGVYLAQIFKKEVGTTFLKYLTGLRMEAAKRLLESGECNITEAAEKVGYKSGQYFSQIFLKNVGMKPQEYRKWSREKERKNN
ncbi:MAG: response regulator [Blautia sp.]|jgi:two-component system response regulator YesN